MAEPSKVEALSLSVPAVLRLLQLGSAALPIGAFAYSQGLEQAVHLGDVSDLHSAVAWTTGMLHDSVLSCDVPVLVRLHAAWSSRDEPTLRYWNDFLFACRGSAELRSEERQVGSALARLLVQRGITAGEPWRRDPRTTLATSFALAAVSSDIGAREAALGYAFAWAEAQVGAATRLIPLGQSEAQVNLSALLAGIAAGLDRAMECADSRIAASTTGQAMLSALHETQYCRLFRS